MTVSDNGLFGLGYRQELQTEMALLSTDVCQDDG